ncbi:Protein phosphatase ImpM [plant metagenome]|uniref:Protein phosphatase ImpM n=1 Tax=plant metagenome TaxID=1297885 RepID=A0A484QIN3_9ZZZZ
MPGALMIGADAATPPAGTRLGWYGKIPAAGDFVHRGVPRELIAWWDKWAQHGLSALKQMPLDAQREFTAAPLWNFAIPAGPGAGAVQLGTVAPSRDRVGRLYPLWAVWSVPLAAYESSVLDGAGPYYREASTALLSAVRHGSGAEQLDRALNHAAIALRPGPPQPPPSSAGQDILDILNSGPGQTRPLVRSGPEGWPDLPACFNPGSHTSYWWTSQVDGAALQTYLHGGALNATLFARLFVASGRARF